MSDAKCAASTPAAACSSRRDFLQHSAGLAAGAASVSALAADQPAAGAKDFPVIRLGNHQVSRLIVGGNPIYGYSHFNRLLSQHQTNWHTPERVTGRVVRIKSCN